MSNHMNELIEDILDDLEKTYEEDQELFHKQYPLLPLDIYKKIEKLATCKSAVNKDLCRKSKKIADLYHRNIK